VSLLNYTLAFALQLRKSARNRFEILEPVGQGRTLAGPVEMRVSSLALTRSSPSSPLVRPKFYLVRLVPISQTNYSRVLLITLMMEAASTSEDVGKLLPDYVAQHTKRQSSSGSFLKHNDTSNEETAGFYETRRFITVFTKSPPRDPT
jgi:hypothetical protein